mgnify:CR=1 FL=1|jgi:YbbR domain-containing protein
MMVMIILFLTIIFFLYLKNKKTKNINYVYINEKTKKYHLEGCPYSKNLKQISLEKAIEEKYIPCKICNINKNYT